MIRRDRRFPFLAVGAILALACLNDPLSPGLDRRSEVGLDTAGGVSPVLLFTLTPGDELSIDFRSHGCFHDVSFAVRLVRDSRGASVTVIKAPSSLAPGWRWSRRSTSACSSWMASNGCSPFTDGAPRAPAPPSIALASRVSSEESSVMNRSWMGHARHSTATAYGRLANCFHWFAVANPPAGVGSDSLITQRWPRETSEMPGRFARGVPSATVVMLPNANHVVFRSNPVEVLAEIRTFIDPLPPP